MNLRPYQQDAINGIYQYFAHHDGNPLVVMPTGSGKSLVIGDFIRSALQQYRDTRVLKLTHVRELIQQNFIKLIQLWPEAPIGIYSAGLGRKDIHSQIVYAGIQSIHRKARTLGHVDLVLVDEAHLIPRNANTMYGRFLNDLRRINPQLKVIGFTATPFRLDSGQLHQGKGALFDDIAYDVGIAELIEQGYLCEIIPRQTETTLDISGVGKRGGEYIAGQLEQAVDKTDTTRQAVAEIIALGQQRGSWLMFCAGVKHANHVAEEIRAHGIDCATITGDTPKRDRDRIIEDFRAGNLRALTNANVLTTGFDAPGVDLIAGLRPTASTGLHVQMAGRGTRLAEGKENCLFLDFAGNTARHGPLDNLNIKQPGEKGDGEAPIKVCPDCYTILHAAVRKCNVCEHEFPEPEIKIVSKSATSAMLTKQIVEQWIDVTDVYYSKHEKPGKPPSMRVDYQCGISRHSEWVCFEHTGFPREKACNWWSRRMPGIFAPNSVDEALADADRLPAPMQICIKPEGKYTQIVGVEF